MAPTRPPQTDRPGRPDRPERPEPPAGAEADPAQPDGLTSCTAGRTLTHGTTVRATLRWVQADLRAGRGQAVFSVLATAGVIASLLLAAALFSYSTNPWERVFTQTRGAHVWIHSRAQTDLAQLARLDGVTAVSGPYATVRTTAELRGVRAAVEFRAAAEQPPQVARPLLVAGHWLDGDHPDGVVLESSLAEALWARPGDTVRIPGRAGRTRTLHVVGVADTAEAAYRPGEQPGVGWVLPQALIRDGSGSGGETIGLRLNRPGDADYVVQRAVTLLGAEQVVQVSKWQQARADAEGDYRLLGVVFGVFGLGALLAGALVAFGAISTRIRGQLRDIAMLKAVGFTPGQVVRVFVVQHLFLAVVAVALGTLPILALGPHIPGRVGEAAAVWQDLPGHFALLFGITAGAVLLIVAATGLAAWRAGRVPPVPSARAAQPSVRPMSRTTRRTLGLGASSSLVLGWRGAFPRRARALTAVGRLAVPLLLITLAFSAWSTIDLFRDHPAQVGVPAALTARPGPAADLTPLQIREVLAADPDVTAVLPGAEVAALVPGQTGTITLRGLGTDDGPYPGAVVEGHAPAGPDEAVAGQGLLDLLQIHVGDWVRVTVEGRPHVLHIVGRSLEPEDGGRVVTTSLDTLRQRDGQLKPEFYQLMLRPGSDPRTVSAQLAEQVDGGLVIRDVPNPADGMQPARWGIAGLVVVLALIGLTELLTTIGACVRDRGRDLLALRAMGLTPRQISGVIVASTGFITLAAAGVGIGLGVLVSGRLIDAQGRMSGIGAGIARLPDPWSLLALGGAAVLGAVAVSALPAARAARRRLADSLSETL
jgi:putative ABC transport system permease protein